MKLSKKLTVALAAMLVAIVSANSALAHRFNTTLMLTDSGRESAVGKEFRNGFMLATTERDGHPDEKSDGHLGGLDVYVAVLDQKQGVAELNNLINNGEAGIVVLFGAEPSFQAITKIADGKSTAVMLPGKSPFAQTENPGVAAFINNYTRVYGKKPTPSAAAGYNAARRVDAAVLIEGGADNIDILQRSFAQTANNFTWENY